MSPTRPLGAALLALAFGLSNDPSQAAPSTPDIVLAVDATDTAHRLLRVRETIRASPGRLVLRYPQWIPGRHKPSNRVSALAGLIVRVGGRPIPWVRDALDPYTFAIDVPKGASAVDLEFQALSALDRASGEVFSSPGIVRVDWHTVALYPAGRDATAISIAPSLTVTSGWEVATSLRRTVRRNDREEYAPVDFATLLDSPAYAARYLARNVVPAGRPVSIDVAAEDGNATVVPPEQLAAFGRAFAQARLIFGSEPYERYDFLVTLSSRLSPMGVEHQQSSEDSLPLSYFSDPQRAYNLRNLMVHEYIHAWNGKLHRPDGLVVADFNTPMRDDLLWVYEGLTTYLDKVVTVRGGLWTPDDGRGVFAETFAHYEGQAGRAWRPLQDTTMVPVAGDAPSWSDWAREEDYYEEASLLWLDVDVRIRELSGGKRSLDDFLRTFLGGGDTDRRVKPYRFDDVVAALNAVQPYDWARLLRSRLDTVGQSPLREDLARAGYRLSYSATPSWIAREQARTKGLMLDYSLGASLGVDGAVRSVVWGGPAYGAGLLPGYKIVAVDGAPFSPAALLAAIEATRMRAGPVTLSVDGPDGARTVAVSVSGGLRYARLERLTGTVDRLAPIFAAR